MSQSQIKGLSTDTGSFNWVVVTGTSKTISAGNGYIPNNASLVTFTLPVTCSVGDTFQIAGKGTGMWKLAQNAGQYIVYGDQQSTTGIAGYLEAVHERDSIEVICMEANTEFQVLDSIGNITVL